MTKLSHFLACALLLSVGASGAAAMQVCVEDRAGVGAPGRDGFVRELQALLPELELELEKGGCKGAAVRLTLLDDKVGIPDDALGLAYRGNGSILPRLEVFVERVRRLTGASDWRTVGRALARVAAHELVHFRSQTSDHREQGLMAEQLSRTDLVSEDLRPRLITNLERD